MASKKSYLNGSWGTGREHCIPDCIIRHANPSPRQIGRHRTKDPCSPLGPVVRGRPGNCRHIVSVKILAVLLRLPCSFCPYEAPLHILMGCRQKLFPWRFSTLLERLRNKRGHSQNWCLKIDNLNGRIPKAASWLTACIARARKEGPPGFIPEWVQILFMV